MPLKKILNDDWSDYDNKKKKVGDANFFACTESWEVVYLKNKISKHYPFKSDESILLATRTCCNSIPSPRPREKFVECVLKRLTII